MAALFWFVFAMCATVIQIYVLPVASTDQSISATILVGLLATIAAPALAAIASALMQKMCARSERNLPGRVLCRLLAIPYVSLMLAVVGSPFIYFVYTTRAEFNAYPASREMPVEKVLAGNTCNSPPLFALISDTHITDKNKTLEDKTDGDGKLRRTLAAIRNVCPKLLIVSGDLTDQKAKGSHLVL